MRSALEQVETGVLDTHPSTNDRIAAAMAEDTAGVFSAQAPSSELFSNFDALCNDVTDNYYRSDLGLEYDPHRTIGVAAAAERVAAAESVR